MFAAPHLRNRIDSESLLAAKPVPPEKGFIDGNGRLNSFREGYGDEQHFA